MKRQQVNLYRPEFKPQTTPLSAASMFRVAVIAVIGFGVLTWYAQSQLKPLREESAEMRQAVADGQQRVKDLSAQYPTPVASEALQRTYDQQRQLLNQTQEVVLKLRAGAFGSPDGLSTFLAGLARQHVAGTWLTGVSIERGGSAIGLDGKALPPELVPVMIRKLSEEPAFKGKVFTNLELNAVEDSADEIQFSVRTAGITVEAGS